MKTGFALIALVTLTLVLPQHAHAVDGTAGRVALVIGNARYPDAEAPLKESINDARDIADELKRDGFDVDIGENLSGEGMRRALQGFYGKVRPGSVALLFFSGFGIQSARQSYMIPVDAQIWSEPDVRRDGFSLETVLNEINGRGAGIKIALMDASRRNPFERRFRSFSAGLAPVIAPRDTLVMYSAAPSSVVSDAGAEHGLFVAELLKGIRVPGLTAEQTLNKIRISITRASRSEQVPWISSSLADDFAFTAPSTEATAAKPADPVPQASAAAPATTATAATATDPREDAGIVSGLVEDPTVKSLNARLAENPDDGAALYRRGQVFASKGAYASALKDFDAAIKLSPKDVEAFNNRCWVRAVTDDLIGALKDCNEALRLRPGFVDALDSRGLVNLKNGQSKNAVADFDDALKINPQLTSSLYGRGLARQRLGQKAEGDLDVSNARAMDPDIVKEFSGYGIR
jgi:uncharacterized caspase-like protein